EHFARGGGQHGDAVLTVGADTLLRLDERVEHTNGTGRGPGGLRRAVRFGLVAFARVDQIEISRSRTDVRGVGFLKRLEKLLFLSAELERFERAYGIVDLHLPLVRSDSDGRPRVETSEGIVR